MSPFTLSHLSSLIAAFPPVPGPSMFQDSLAIFYQVSTKPSDFKSITFPQAFKDIYGSPMTYYTDLLRLSSIQFDKNALPTPKSVFEVNNEDSMFLWFAKTVDNKVRQHFRANMATFTRPMMEAAWVFYAFSMFDIEREKMGQVFWDNDEQRERLQAALCKIIKMRIHPKEKVEAYWVEKGANSGLSGDEIVLKKEGCDEAQDQMRVAEDDDVPDSDDSDEEMKDEVMEDTDSDDEREELVGPMEDMQIDRAV